jgi:hypothetical protein
MKKFFLIVMLFLLPFQYTWAMVASYDTHGTQDTDVHFGHHEHQPMANHHDNTDLADDNESNTHTQTSNKSHDHFGFLHMSCGEVLSHDLPIFVPESKQFSTQYLFNSHPPPANALERPNWTVSV